MADTQFAVTPRDNVFPRPVTPVQQEVVDGADVAAPDVGSFQEFYALTFQPLTMQLWAYTGELAQAQDVVQDAFCQLFERWDRVGRYDDPAAWVRRVAWNLATNRFRRARTFLRYARRQRETYAPEPSPDRVMLVAALAELPATQRRALVKFHLGDLSIGEIAVQEGVSAGTVKSWLHRGRAVLAARLAAEEGE